MKVKELQNRQAYKTAIKKGVVLINFSAPWCVPCHYQKPILEQLATKINTKALIAGVNIDTQQKLASSLGIRSIPTLIIYKNNVEIQRFIGLQSHDTLFDALVNLME